MAAFLSDHSLVLNDKLVSLTLHTLPLGFYGGRVDIEQMRHPRLEPLSRPLFWELAATCKHKTFATFSVLFRVLTTHSCQRPRWKSVHWEYTRAAGSVVIPSTYQVASCSPTMWDDIIKNLPATEVIISTQQTRYFLWSHSANKEKPHSFFLPKKTTKF